MTIPTTILTHEGHWGIQCRGSLRTLRVGCTLCSQSHSMANVNAACPQVPQDPFSSPIFVSTVGTLSMDEESLVVGCDSQVVEVRAAGVPSLVLG